MFAELLEVSPAMVRQWHRRGWLRESEIIQRLPYFALTELLPAKRLAQLAKNGLDNAEIAKKLDALQALFPDIDRPIAALDLRIDGRDIFLTKEGQQVDTVGQKLLDFAHDGNVPAEQICNDFPVSQLDSAFQGVGGREQGAEESESKRPTPPCSLPSDPDKGELCRYAYHCEEQGRLEQAVEYFRVALAAGGPDAAICFQLGELLYRLDDKTAARERYYMAIEIDEHFVEARATLGCVLAETNDWELAVSAFQGALLHHPDYADVHYHLGMTLQKLGKTLEAEQHLRRFRELMPNSPWTER
jgi:tetratricopeptide (TPR) repeat protein